MYIYSAASWRVINSDELLLLVIKCCSMFVLTIRTKNNLNKRAISRLLHELIIYP